MITQVLNDNKLPLAISTVAIVSIGWAIWFFLSPLAQVKPLQAEGVTTETIEPYADCVNSRLPMKGTYLTQPGIAHEVREGRLDADGMSAAYRSLGCGILVDPQKE